MLVALHFTPVSKWVSRVSEYRSFEACELVLSHKVFNIHNTLDNLSSASVEKTIMCQKCGSDTDMMVNWVIWLVDKNAGGCANMS